MVGGGFALRYDSVFKDAYEIDLHAGDESYEVGLLSAFDKYIRLSGRYTFIPNRTLRMDLFSSYYHAFPLAGGTGSLSFNIGQDINLSGFALNYRVGVIAGLNYSLYSDDLHFSFSPNILLEIGYAIQDFSLLLYATGERFYETTFQSVPIIGLKTEIGFSDQRICLDCYVKLADYMEGPTILLSDIAMRVSYEVEL